MKEMKISTSTSMPSPFLSPDSYTKKCIILFTALFCFTFVLGVFTGSFFEFSQITESLGSGYGTSDTKNGEFSDPGYQTHDTSTPKPVFSMKEMRSQISKVRNVIDKYYGNFSDMLAASTPPGMNYHNEQYKEILDYQSENILNSLLTDGKYTIGVIGSSVAAGHDNCAYDNYEQQLERQMQDIWSIDGLNGFEVQNAGMGGGCGDTHQNQVGTTLGNVDMVHYSWSYFEHRDNSPKQHEQILRWSLMMNNQPATMLFNVGGNVNTCIDEKKKYNDALFKKYHGFGYSAICLESLLFSNGKFKGKEWGKVGDGRHDVTRYGEQETGDRRESLGVVFRNWHPGPLGFQSVSDAFAWLHLDALEIALKKYEDGKKPANKVLSSTDLGDPLFCEDECKQDTPPSCMNLESPTFGWQHMRLVQPDDDLNPYFSDQGSLMKPKYFKPYLKENGVGYEVPKQEANDPKCAHHDQCGFIEMVGESDDTINKWIVIQLPRMEVGYIALCGCCNKKVGEEMFMTNEAFEIEFDGTRLDNSTFDIWPNEKCVRVLNGFPQDLHDETGHLYLAFRVSRKPDKEIRISSIIAV
eukprot:maker-scaffold_9-snap-gene-4.6-mRNA-1 protein AED:0.02 eAED:0.02 QI:148/1/1/1/0.75/0.6/5/29/580